MTRGDKPQVEITSLMQFNRKIWGFKLGELVVVGARTSNGKTAFVNQLVLDFIDQSIPTLYFSLEMSEEEILERMFCNKYRVYNMDMLTGKMKISEDYQARYKSFKRLIAETKAIITCGIGSRFDEIVSFYEMMEEKPKIMVLDYIQAIKMKSGQSYDDISEFVRKMREFAVKNKMLVVIVSQINRDAGNKRPESFMLKGSGVLEEHCDKCILLHWEYLGDNSKDKNKFEIVLSKNRNGRTGKFECYYIPEYYLFLDDEIEARRLIHEQNYLK